MLVYDRLMVGQFLVETQIRTMAKDKDKKPIFFGNFKGRSVLFHSGFYRSPFASDGEVLAMDLDFENGPENVKLDTFVHAVCENGPRGPRAIRWCTLKNFSAGVIECDQQRETAQRISEIVEEALRQFQAKRDKERTENPANIDEALAHGWVIVEGGNGRQRILERQFSGEPRPRRITRHLQAKTAPAPARRFASVS